MSELDAAGFGVHFHALGDRAVREALDAVAAARATNGYLDTRPHLAHLQIVHPDDLTLPFLTPERGSWQYPFAGLVAAGAHLAAGSDWPVSSADPLAGLHVAVNRVAPDAPPGTPVFLPAQRLDLATALTAYTAGSAYVSHLDECGTIEPGNLADLAVLDRDPFAHPVGEIAHTRVLRTIVGGRTVFSAQG